jgi:hypothetical protein
MSLHAEPVFVEPDALDELSDHDLLAGGVVATIAEARAAAQKWARLVTYFRRRQADDDARHDESPHFALTPRQQTVVEVGELWGMPESWVRKQLNIALCLSGHCAYVWRLCLEGRLDTYRASIIADAARHCLDQPEEYAALARRLERFLTRHLKPLDGIDADVESVVACTPRQLRNKLAYEINKIRSADAETRHRKAREARDVRVTDGEDGMSWLTLTATTDQIRLAAHRLTLTAKDLRGRGDERTLDQLRSDLAVDLLTGPGDGVPLPAYARPVINLTVPIQTVMGFSDDPGVLSGGRVVPAGLARAIAQTPGATWHRMLTDPAGQMVELSTTRYQPTKAIWTQVVAEHTSCFRSGCDTPSTESELDHRRRWPLGPTTPENLWPGCKTDHKAKHAPGFTIEQDDTGSFVLTTPAGFRHPATRPQHPVSDSWPLPDDGIQFSATGILDTLARLRDEDAASRPIRYDLDWEEDFDERLWELYSQAN